MNTKEWLHKKLPLTALILALTFFVLSMTGNNSGDDTEDVAAKAARRLKDRIEILDSHIRTALDAEKDKIALLDGIPEDMVIYRYVNDSLQFWSNQFTILNDDIASRHVFQMLTDRKSRIVSFLTDAEEDFTYMNLGPKWYLVKLVQEEVDVKVIAGLEIKNTLIDDIRRNENGINPKLGIPGKYSVLPLNHTGGSTVEIDGQPLFKIIQDTSQAIPFFDNSLLRWVSLLLLAIAIVMFLAGHRTIKVYAVVVFTLTVLCAVSYIWGIQMTGATDLFSPTVYADGQGLSSLMVPLVAFSAHSLMVFLALSA